MSKGGFQRLNGAVHFHRRSDLPQSALCKRAYHCSLSCSKMSCLCPPPDLYWHDLVLVHRSRVAGTPFDGQPSDDCAMGTAHMLSFRGNTTVRHADRSRNCHSAFNANGRSTCTIGGRSFGTSGNDICCYAGLVRGNDVCESNEANERSD